MTIKNELTKISKSEKPYILASSEWKSEKTIVDVCGIKIGGDETVVIAGPCSVESHEQVLSTARFVKNHGAVMLRGGAYKPRTSPYEFQGLGREALEILREVGDETG